MKWKNANEHTPIEDAVMRLKETKMVIPNQHIYQQLHDRIVMDNGYSAVGINGQEYLFTDIEWLDESETEQPSINDRIEHNEGFL